MRFGIRAHRLPASSLKSGLHPRVEMLESRCLLSSTLSVPATADLWIPAGATDGTTPPSITFAPAVAGQYVTFSSVTGKVNNAKNIFTEVWGPDGHNTNQTTGVNGVGGVSGIDDTVDKDSFALLGLFTGNTIPATNPPATQNYASITSDSSFSPLLDQVFFIGDGKTGRETGSIQQFLAPNGATHLYIGFADGRGGDFGPPDGYDDNVGTLTATLAISAAPTTGTLSGTIFHDLNGSGIQNAGEPGLSGRTVDLETVTNNVVVVDKTATTNAAGAYTFTGLAPGSYRVAQTLPAGWIAVSPSATFSNVTITAGVTSTANFADALPATIDGTVFNDLNGDGYQQSNEPGLAGFTVYIDNNDSGQFETGDLKTSTNAAGQFSFQNLAPGTYLVRVAPPSGYSATSYPASVAVDSGWTINSVAFGYVQST